MVEVRPHAADDLGVKGDCHGQQSPLSGAEFLTPEPAELRRRSSKAMRSSLSLFEWAIKADHELPGAGRQYCNDGLSDEGIFSGILDLAIKRRESPLTGC